MHSAPTRETQPRGAIPEPGLTQLPSPVEHQATGLAACAVVGRFPTASG